MTALTIEAAFRKLRGERAEISDRMDVNDAESRNRANRHGHFYTTFPRKGAILYNGFFKKTLDTHLNTQNVPAEIHSTGFLMGLSRIIAWYGNFDHEVPFFERKRYTNIP